jgi:catechol 2,3-dioxygenase-like lactoylglutathione lyase family enzyme
MSVTNLKPIGFIATANAEAARAFYETTLGLEFVIDDSFAMVFRTGTMMVRVVRVRVKDYEPLPYTVFGWEAPEIENAVDALAANGVVFERFSFFEQDARGIWTAPNGNQVAWFKDPDGNLLSLSKH